MAGSSEDEAPPAKTAAQQRDPYWWTPWAVLIGLVTYGALGFAGVFSRPEGGPTAADVPVEAPAKAKAAARPPRKQAGDGNPEH